MYTLEVEIALDTGRPICIRNSDIDVEWPVEINDDVLSFLLSYNPTEHNKRSKRHGHATRAFQGLIPYRSRSIL
jgi:hypothetical protein